MNLKEAEEKMKKAIEATQNSFNTVRTGRASASLLDRVM
ncbi:MAG: ribosome recycling factor, partial [Trichodesmium sp. St2_bin6]|nr:ribosome recycling factor [Trichodesmium sp. St2_bin6]